MAKIVFVIALALALTFQWIGFNHGIIDGKMWANQAEYVQNGEPGEFDFHAAYGHPGSPIIDATVLIHNLSGMPFLGSFTATMALLNGIFIAAICLLCFLLSKNYLLPIPVFIMLTFSQLYDVTTPPSALVSLSIVFLFLFTVYIYKNRKTVTTDQLILWGIASGFTVATRADIGTIMVIAFSLLLFPVLGWKKMLWTFIWSFFVFLLLDPFMWLMPVQHIQDLVWKIVYHYADIAPSRISFLNLISFSSLALLGVICAVAFWIFGKKIESPIPIRMIKILLATTAALCIIFLTAKNQELRYFQPLIFIWEVLLVFFSLSSANNINFNFLKTQNRQEVSKKIAQICIVLMLSAYPFIIQLYALSPFCKIMWCWSALP